MYPEASNKYPPNQVGAAVTARPATVQSAIEDFDAVLSRLEQAAIRATNCADRISGGRPSGVDGKEPAPSPSHLIYAIQARRERLVRVVEHVESEIIRIETGLAPDRS